MATVGICLRVVGAGVQRFASLSKFPVGSNSSGAKRIVCKLWAHARLNSSITGSSVLVFYRTVALIKKRGHWEGRVRIIVQRTPDVGMLPEVLKSELMAPDRDTCLIMLDNCRSSSDQNCIDQTISLSGM